MTSLMKPMVDYGNKDSAASRMRLKRLTQFLVLVEDVFNNHGEVKILDLGGTLEFWQLLKPEVLCGYNMHITIVNLYPASIYTLPERFAYIQADICMPGAIPDTGYHIVHSNSVIEHLGSVKNKNSFSNEVRRLAKRYFIQTPSFSFPVEPHFLFPFFHWLPKSLRLYMLRTLNMGHFKKANSREEAEKILTENQLITLREFKSYFAEAEIRVEHFMGLPKSYIAVYAADKHQH